MTPDQIVKWDGQTLGDYWQALTEIEAEETLLLMKIAIYPKMSDQDRRDLHREVHQAAHPMERTRLEIKGSLEAIING